MTCIETWEEWFEMRKLFWKWHEVHIGRTHTDYFDCGLCERNFDASEKLETHLNTCEMFVEEDVAEEKQPLQISKTMLKNTQG